MARTRPCSSRLATSALKSASDIPRIHGGRRLPPRGRSPPSGGRFRSFGGGGPASPSVGGGGKLAAKIPLVPVKLVSSGNGPRREKSSPRGSPFVMLRKDGGKGRTTGGLLLVTPSGLTLAPSTGRTNMTNLSDHCS